MPTSTQAAIRAGKINPKKPVVALTFDDGPGIYTSRILDTLQHHEGRVSFFVEGRNIAKNKSTLLRAFNMGNEIICHTWNHHDMTTLSGRAIKKELFDTIAAIAKLTGTVSLMFRPPYGNINKKVEKISLSLGLAIIKWSLDTRDWETKDTEAIYTKIANEVTNGDIILCHDSIPATAEAMSRIIPELIAHDCQLVTVSELLHFKYGEIEPGRTYLS